MLKNLHFWSKHHFENLKHKIKALWAQFSDAYQANDMATVNQILNNLDLSLAQEDVIFCIKRLELIGYLVVFVSRKVILPPFKTVVGTGPLNLGLSCCIIFRVYLPLKGPKLIFWII